jgi:hypothetical protein
MECYHCESAQAKLKCADCDSEIFRFCSNQCGVEAHDDHKVVCYNRNSLEQIENHLYAAIEEMRDTQEINDAMEVASELILAQEDVDYDLQSVMQEAHEIIQGHIQNIGVELIGAQRKNIDFELVETKNNRKAEAKERAKRDREYRKKVNKLNRAGWWDRKKRQREEKKQSREREKLRLKREKAEKERKAEREKFLKSFENSK